MSTQQKLITFLRMYLYSHGENEETLLHMSLDKLLLQFGLSDEILLKQTNSDISLFSNKLNKQYKNQLEANLVSKKIILLEKSNSQARRILEEKNKLILKKQCLQSELDTTNTDIHILIETFKENNATTTQEKQEHAEKIKHLNQIKISRQEKQEELKKKYRELQSREKEHLKEHKSMDMPEREGGHVPPPVDPHDGGGRGESEEQKNDPREEEGGETEEQTTDHQEREGETEERKNDPREREGETEERKNDPQEREGETEEQKNDPQEREGETEEQKNDPQEREGETEEQKNDPQEREGETEERKNDPREEEGGETKEDLNIIKEVAGLAVCPFIKSSEADMPFHRTTEEWTITTLPTCAGFNLFDEIGKNKPRLCGGFVWKCGNPKKPGRHKVCSNHLMDCGNWLKKLAPADRPPALPALEKMWKFSTNDYPIPGNAGKSVENQWGKWRILLKKHTDDFYKKHSK